MNLKIVKRKNVHGNTVLYFYIGPKYLGALFFDDSDISADAFVACLYGDQGDTIIEEIDGPMFKASVS